MIGNYDQGLYCNVTTKTGQYNRHSMAYLLYDSCLSVPGYDGDGSVGDRRSQDIPAVPKSLVSVSHQCINMYSDTSLTSMQ